MQAVTAHWSDLHEASLAPLAASTFGPAQQRATKILRQTSLPDKNDGRYQYSRLRFLKDALPKGEPQGREVDLKPYLTGEEASVLVLTDGAFRPDLSTMGEVELLRIADVEPGDGFEDLLLRMDVGELFTVATAQDGFLLRIPEGKDVGQVHLLHVATGTDSTRSLLNLVHVGANARMELLESFVHTASESSAQLQFTSLELGANAHVQWTRIQRGDRLSKFLGSMRADLDRDAHLDVTVLTTGSSWSRQTMEARLRAEGAYVNLQGLTFAHRDQHADIWTRIEHQAPHTQSVETFKSILDDNGHASFTGNIFVAKDAQKVESDQQSRNLLLSRKAKVDTSPQLEIFADDVKCAHGSTIGRLDEDQIFFLRTRGIGIQQARMILTRAFADEVLEKVQNPGTRKLLSKYLHLWFVKHQEHLGAQP